jgi:hypothetical protein
MNDPEAAGAFRQAARLLAVITRLIACSTDLMISCYQDDHARHNRHTGTTFSGMVRAVKQFYKKNFLLFNAVTGHHRT